MLSKKEIWFNLLYKELPGYCVDIVRRGEIWKQEKTIRRLFELVQVRKFVNCPIYPVKYFVTFVSKFTFAKFFKVK